MRGRKHRLPIENYIGRKSVAFTACLKKRHRELNDPEIVSSLVSILQEAVESQECSVPIYTFMPDHVHILMLGMAPESNLKVAMDQFKAKAGWWTYLNRPYVKWQEGYWDHIVRAFEGSDAQARYIAGNPCRAGLCQDVFAWPYTGSIGHDLKEVILDSFW